jgi:hypothetical protein
MQNACAMLPSVACLALHYCWTLPYKRHDFKKKVIEHKMCFLIFATILSETLFSLRRIQRDLIVNIHKCSCKVPVIPVGF